MVDYTAFQACLPEICLADKYNIKYPRSPHEKKKLYKKYGLSGSCITIEVKWHTVSQILDRFGKSISVFLDCTVVH